MKAVINFTGKDNVGIVAKVATECSSMGANIIDISQSVMREYFAMIVLVDIDGLSCAFGDFVDKMGALGDANGLRIATMHEDIFNSMHRI